MRIYNKMNSYKLIATVIFVYMGINCLKASDIMKVDTINNILINQVGYQPNGSKIALIRSVSDKFNIIDINNGEKVFSGILGKPAYWELSKDSVRSADFSALVISGEYKLCIEGKQECSYKFRIEDTVYHNLAKMAIKAFYFNRASFEITPEFGGKWARPAGHPDTAVIIHESATSANRPAGTIVSSPGGWYDAGDYNKYTVNSGISTYTLLLFYQMFPEYCKNLNTNIPESNNNIPDVVDELLYNLKWMLTMQDTTDGGVYHKVTNKNFDGFIMPDKAIAPRYMVQKSTAATLDFAAVMAKASQIFSKDQNNDLKALSKTCYTAALKAMAWANANPVAYYKQPDDIHTGGYSENHLEDEFFWASCEISIMSKGKPLVSLDDLSKVDASTPSWGNVGTLGIISLALSNDTSLRILKELAIKKLVDYTNKLVEKYNSSAYKVSIDHLAWGSNSDVANEAMLKIISYKLTNDKIYLNAFQGDLDYLLGKNATGYCFVTGTGTISPMHIHHRISGSDGIIDPIPGLLVGGPHKDWRGSCKENIEFDSPAKSYFDAICSFPTNEIAINWNAPLFFIVGAIDCIGNDKY
jgi:endoglucanase